MGDLRPWSKIPVRATQAPEKGHGSLRVGMMLRGSGTAVCHPLLQHLTQGAGKVLPVTDHLQPTWGSSPGGVMRSCILQQLSWAPCCKDRAWRRVQGSCCSVSAPLVWLSTA